MRWPWSRPADRSGEILDRLASLETQVRHTGDMLMSTVDDLRNALASHDAVIDQAIATIKTLHDQLAAVSGDNPALDAIRADLQAKTAALAAAMADAAGNPAPAPDPVDPAPS